MTIKTFFVIFAVLAVMHGIGFVIVPDQVAAAYGLAVSASSRLTAQLFGGALLFWGVTLWFARDFPSEAVRGVLIGTIIADVPSLIVVVMGTLAGTMSANLSALSGRVRILLDGTDSAAIAPISFKRFASKKRPQRGGGLGPPWM
jgi:hypothetical protein